MTRHANEGAAATLPSYTRPLDECVVCGSARGEILRKDDITQHRCWSPGLPETLTWKRCTCGHVYSTTVWTAEGEAKVFGSVQPGQKVGDNLVVARMMAGQIIDRVKAYVPRGSWLDVGIGNGALVMTAAEYGYEAHGLDLRRENIEVIKALGIGGTVCPIEEMGGDGRIDVISMADVLEHMADPRSAIDAAFRLLRPWGVLFVSCPNREAPAWRVLDMTGANPYWNELEHVHNFGRGDLTLMLNEHGFDVVSYGVSHRYLCGMELIAIKGAA